MPFYLTTEEVVNFYHTYKREHGITAQTHWIIGRGVLPHVRGVRDAAGHYIYDDVITPTKIHHTLMGLSFEVSETDADALYLGD